MTFMFDHVLKYLRSCSWDDDVFHLYLIYFSDYPIMIIMITMMESEHSQLSTPSRWRRGIWRGWTWSRGCPNCRYIQRICHWGRCRCHGRVLCPLVSTSTSTRLIVDCVTEVICCSNTYLDVPRSISYLLKFITMVYFNLLQVWSL